MQRERETNRDVLQRFPDHHASREVSQSNESQDRRAGAQTNERPRDVLESRRALDSRVQVDEDRGPQELPKSQEALLVLESNRARAKPRPAQSRCPVAQRQQDHHNRSNNWIFYSI